MCDLIAIDRSNLQSVHFVMAALPRVGLGTWQATDPAALENAIIYAVEEVGYRYIDTAHVYENEEIVGAAIGKILAKGKLKRSDLFVTTKLWLVNRRPELVEPAIRASLARLKLDYVDLYLIHWPASYVPQPDGYLFPKGPDGKALLEHIDILDTWAAMEQLVEKGLTKHIGVSNFSIEMLERLEISPKVKIQPFANQVEQSIYNQQLAMIQYLSSRGIALTSWSSFANGKVGPFGVPLLQDPVLLEIAGQVKKTPGQVALKYLLQLSPVVNLIPKSVTPERIKENFSLDFTLSPEQVAKIKARNVGFRINNGIDEFGYDILSLGL
jgi:diketogulonate reductase-like aldo/keto reductase